MSGKNVAVKVIDVDKSVRMTMGPMFKVDGDNVVADEKFISIDKDGAILFDAGQIYPVYLKELKMSVDKFSVEVARRCATEDIARVVGGQLHIRIVNADDYILKNLKEREGMKSGSAERGAASFRTYHTDLVKARSTKK